MKKYIGWILVALVTVVTLVLFTLSKDGESIILSWRTATQIVSLVGTAWICISFVMITRWNFINDIFGGIDKMYKAHHIIGGLAFVMILYHPLFLVVSVLPNLASAMNYLYLSGNLSYNLGLISIYSFLALLVLTFLIDLPYSLWKKTHNYMGLPLVIAGLHIITITSDVSRYLPLKLWMILLIFLATFAAFYKRFLYEKYGPRYNYKIVKVDKSDDVYIFSLLEIGEAMVHKPGQFVFLKIDCLGDEYHPYSIVSSPNEKYLRIAIKVLGDYTLGLGSVCVEASCSVQGPYGNFYKPMETEADIVMVAGGIGITPFIGMIKEDLTPHKERKIHLFYTVRNKEDAVFLDEITLMCRENNCFTWNLVVSSMGNRISADFIKSSLGEIKNKKFLLCGPQKMMYEVADGLKNLGTKNTDIIYEDFSFK